MISAAEGAAVLMLAGMAIYDCAHRRLPHVLVLNLAWILLAGAIIGWWDLSWQGLATGLVLAIVADVPGGDLKALVLLGALAGGLSTAWTFAVAGWVTLAAWRLTERRTWPWLPLLFASYLLVSGARRLL